MEILIVDDQSAVRGALWLISTICAVWCMIG
jgi:hypothetical protein